MNPRPDTPAVSPSYTADPASDPDTAPGEWQALHIHYSSDSTPILTECVGPLVARLRERGLLHRYFFMNYWMEGPHVRLRLRPTTVGATAEVLAEAEGAIRAFLKRRPSLYEVDEGYMLDLYNEMFRLEYSEEERKARYGDDGRMPLRENNSYYHTPYEPEYLKYGGPRGIELAEWHFEHSSDMILEILDTTNVHIRTVMLGLATQLMMIMSSSFLGEREQVASFMNRYHEFWYVWFNLDNEDRSEAYRNNYETLQEELGHRFGEIHGAISGGRLERLSAFGRRWALHCAELRRRVVELAEDGGLEFPPRDQETGRFPVDGGDAPETLTDPKAALHLLLFPYMHMTNNRLGANVVDESYLSYLLARTLDDATETTAAP